MSNNAIACEKKSDHPMLAVSIGNTTYLVGIHFNEAAKETIDDKLKRLICKDVQKQKTVS